MNKRYVIRDYWVECEGCDELHSADDVEYGHGADDQRHWELWEWTCKACGRHNQKIVMEWIEDDT